MFQTEKYVILCKKKGEYEDIKTLPKVDNIVFELLNMGISA